MEESKRAYNLTIRGKHVSLLISIPISFACKLEVKGENMLKISMIDDNQMNKAINTPTKNIADSANHHIGKVSRTPKSSNEMQDIREIVLETLKTNRAYHMKSHPDI